MNRTDTVLQIPSQIPSATANDAPIANVQRLAIVLFEAEEEALLARRIVQVTAPRRLSVLLIGIAPDPTGEAKLRRSLATLAGFLRDQSHVTGPVETRMEVGKDWMAGIKALVHPGDMLACYSEQTIGVMERPLCDILSSDLNLPVYAFSGLPDRRPRRKIRLSQVTSWLGSLVSIGAFLLLQARIVSAAQGWPQTVLLIVALFAEAGVLWFINSLLAQA